MSDSEEKMDPYATQRCLNHIYMNWQMLQYWYSCITEEGKEDITNYFNNGVVDNLGQALFGVDCNYEDLKDLIKSFEEKEQWHFIKFWRETE